MREQNKGITLIVLVITIIILLILAGITLTILGKQGILNIAKKATQDYKNAEDKELEDLERLYSEIKVATGEDTKITISMEDLNKIIEDKVNKGIESKETTLREKIQKLESELTQKINDVPRFIDTDNLITTIQEQGTSWVATKDCAVICNLRVTNSMGASVSVDGIVIAGLVDQQAKDGGDSRFTSVVYVKKGSTISTRENYGIYDLKIYGLK